MENKQGGKKRNLGGRPNLANDEVLQHRLVTRVTAKDYRDIDQDFKQWKTGRVGRIADFLREIILNRRNKGAQNPSLDRDQTIEQTQTLHSIRQQLKRIEVNYNQIAKRINSIEHTRKLYYEIQDSKHTINQLAQIINQINSLVKAQTEALYKAE
jgi:hypothetical protein